MTQLGSEHVRKCMDGWGFGLVSECASEQAASKCNVNKSERPVQEERLAKQAVNEAFK